MRWDGEKGEKNIPSSSPLLSNSRMEFGRKCWEKKLMQAAPAAFKSLSCSVQLLRCSSQAGITRGQQAWTDRARAGSRRGVCASKHCVPNRACARRAGKSGAGTVGPKLPGLVTAVSKQHCHPTHTRLRHTHPPPARGEQGEVSIPPHTHFHLETRLEVDGLSTWQHCALSPGVKIPSMKRATIPQFFLVNQFLPKGTAGC